MLRRAGEGRIWREEAEEEAIGKGGSGTELTIRWAFVERSAM